MRLPLLLRPHAPPVYGLHSCTSLMPGPLLTPLSQPAVPLPLTHTVMIDYVLLPPSRATHRSDKILGISIRTVDVLAAAISSYAGGVTIHPDGATAEGGWGGLSADGGGLTTMGRRVGERQLQQARGCVGVESESALQRRPSTSAV